MYILAQNGEFSIGSMCPDEFKHKWNTEDNTLSVWGENKYSPINVHTNRGTFIETIDKSGEVIMSGGDGNWFFVPIGAEPVKLRFKELPAIYLTEADLDKNRKIVTRYLISDKLHNLNIPDTLLDVIKWMKDQLKAIPIASQTNAQFSFDTTIEYGETYPQIEITYGEPETDNEIITRLQIATERARISEEAERTKFHKLQAKFGAA